MKRPVVLNLVLAVAVAVLAIRLAVVEKAAVAGGTAAPADSVAGAASGNFEPFDVTEEFSHNPFSYFRGHGLLLAAGDSASCNAMTIGWGALGTIWGKPAVTVYVRKSRYTHGFMERGQYFTVMRFADNRVVDYMGTHSGRDGDKAQALGLHVAYTGHGAPYYTEAVEVIECRTMSAAVLSGDTFRDDVPQGMYTQGEDKDNWHSQYIGEVVGAMRRK